MPTAAAATATADGKNGKVDRWQSRYLGSVMGLDSLSRSVEQQDRSSCSSPLSQRTSSPIMKRITKPFNSLLDSRRVTPSKSLTSPALNKRYSMSHLATNNCGECHTKLSGKTVRLPDSQVKYHWNCLQCKGCQLPFQDTSFFIDVLKNVYHPNCAPSNAVAQSCSRCSQAITDSYIALNTAVLHPRCLRCTGCQKILHPASIYFDIHGAHCQTCSNEKMDDKELLSKHMKIVPQLQKVAGTTTTAAAAAATNVIEQQHQEKDDEKATSPIEKVVETVKPSSLMSSRGRRPLPRFGVVRDCAGCNQRIYSVHEEIPGPKASKWHKKCLVCTGCNKTLDSGATVHEHQETHTLNPWCTTCLLSKKKSMVHSNSASAVFSAIV
ncbi:C2H2-type zinc finger transcription factor [Mucor lusitanicus CBS 277.49]|uniref:C2H2-type zinc finger transcription factor n=1 Tax=Mucor lusitanicus CBS 277.49 TaxID=747725 RepID=A0A168M877_MUCCL|nr:C2H2-type zinc finger transcription factor [Mucor lusitanicus CBS 277.49]